MIDITNVTDDSVLITIDNKNINSFKTWATSINVDHVIVPFHTDNDYVVRVTSTNIGILTLAALYGKVILFFNTTETSKR